AVFEARFRRVGLFEVRRQLREGLRSRVSGRGQLRAQRTVVVGDEHAKERLRLAFTGPRLALDGALERLASRRRCTQVEALVEGCAETVEVPGRLLQAAEDGLPVLLGVERHLVKNAEQARVRRG